MTLPILSFLILAGWSAMTQAAAPVPVEKGQAPAPPPRAPEVPAKEDLLQPNSGGFKVAQGELGDLNISFYTYARYLNQKALDDTYTDAFGRTKTLDLRNDIQFQKAIVYFKGWLYDPDLRYFAYVWSSNTSQGQGAQVVVAGNLTYKVEDHVTLGVGIVSLPTTRSTEGSFPKFLKVDSRTMADEFFRGSFTTGIWASGSVTDELVYRVMLGNNLSQLGVDAIQLDGKLDTLSASLVWMPSTGEFGPGGGFGDLERHEALATRFGAHATHSTEERQSQPGKEDPENTQIRLSDGTALFDIGAFGPGTQVQQARYVMTSFDAGMKYQGFALEAEYFLRWVSDFHTTGVIPVNSLFDHGFQVQVSQMVLPKFQGYVAGSKIFGQYGDPWDLTVGLNWYPISRKGYERQLRVNAEVLYMRNSPTGNSTVPLTVGGNGPAFVISTELMF
jgi:hypothetical protein